MRIAIIGAGNVGTALGKQFVKTGHEVVYGVKDPASPKYQKLKPQTVKDAVSFADVVVLATPWPAAEAAIRSAGSLSGKIVVDCINPLKPDLSGLALGHTDSAAEQIARWAPGAKVVKAFNQTGADNMANPSYGSQKPVMFVAADDAGAKQTVMQLVSGVGFDAVDTGPLANARLLEPLAMLWIYLAFHGLGRNFAFALLKRS
jgi:8-hydroxy-5-deazaflavin:NADPH oxidoreductase